MSVYSDMMVEALRREGVACEAEAKISSFAQASPLLMRCRFDFFIPSKKIFLEINGAQHFRLSKANPPMDFKSRVERDMRKRRWAWANGFKVIDVNMYHYREARGKCLEAAAYIKATPEEKMPDWKRF